LLDFNASENDGFSVRILRDKGIEGPRFNEMSGQWKEITKIAFKGERFKDHALDLMALAELSQFQRLIAETAKTLWRTQNPDRERLPKRFEDRTRLCLRRIEEGSAVAPLEVYVEDEEEGYLQEEIGEELRFDGPAELIEAVELANEVFEALDEEKPLPERFPRSLLPDYQKWGRSLAEDEEIEIQREGSRTSRTNRRNIDRITELIETPHEASIELVGTVFEANVESSQFQIEATDGRKVPVSFSPEDEEKVTTALKDHASVQIRLVGTGAMTADGRLLKIPTVEKLELILTGEIPFDETARPIWEIFDEIIGEVPPEEWEKLPTDLSENLDHYIYGVPKK
jgi:hypothetical protein